MTELHESVREWEIMSRQAAKPPRVRCPKGHFLSWNNYDYLSKVDGEGNTVYEHGTFCCMPCNRYYNADDCKQKEKQ